MERYEKVRILGRGSYGTAVLVRITGGFEPGLLRVIKEVELDRVDEKNRTEALREAEVLKSLSHPNIIAYDEALLVDTRLCIVMEHADGGDLAGAIERRRAESKKYHEREVLAMFSQLALALEYIHSRRILHRDLKSQNVFLTSAGVPKVGDFGIARVLNGSEICAETQIGTPQNLPPEMCDNHPYDFKADIWCLGIILYEMLALEVPFSASSVAALVMKICTAEPAPIPALYSSGVRNLLARLLAKRPEDRPTSAEVTVDPHVLRGTPAALRVPQRNTGPSSISCASSIVSPASSDATTGTPSPQRHGREEAASKAPVVLAKAKTLALRSRSCSEEAGTEEALPACENDTENGLGEVFSLGPSAKLVDRRHPPQLPPLPPRVHAAPGIAGATASAAPGARCPAAAQTAWTPRSGRVTSAEIAELGLDLNGLDALSPLRGICRPGSRVWVSSSPTSPERLSHQGGRHRYGGYTSSWDGDLAISDVYQESLTPRKSTTPEMTASCCRLLRELERELNLSSS